LKKKQEELEEIGAGFPNPLSLGIRWREKRVLSVLCYVLEPDWALCSSRHGRCDIDPRDKGDIWVAMTRTLHTKGWDAPSSPGDARLGACGRQSPLLLLPSCFTANLPFRGPFFPTSPYLPVAASSGVTNTTILFFVLFFSQMLRRGNWAFNFQINPSDFLFLFYFFPPAAAKVVVMIIINHKQSAFF